MHRGSELALAVFEYFFQATFVLLNEIGWINLVLTIRDVRMEIFGFSCSHLRKKQASFDLPSLNW